MGRSRSKDSLVFLGRTRTPISSSSSFANCVKTSSERTRFISGYSKVVRFRGCGAKADGGGDVCEAGLRGVSGKGLDGVVGVVGVDSLSSERFAS